MKKNIYLKRGFTLIELLVVVAIIGILASVVLASMNSSRVKSFNAAIKAEMNNARSAGELYFANHDNSYDGICDTSSGNNVITIIMSAAKKHKSTAVVGDTTQKFIYGNTGATGNAVCHQNVEGWAAIVSMKSSPTSAGWCVDSGGQSKESTSLEANIVVCP